MIDEETAREGAALISTAIAELLEEAHSSAVLVEDLSLPPLMLRAFRLRAIADDVTVLTQALDVLARRGGLSPTEAAA